MGAQDYKTLVDNWSTLCPHVIRYKGEESIWITGMTEGYQQVAMLEAEVSLTANKWQKHPAVTGLEASCILGIDYIRIGIQKGTGVPLV